MSAMAANESGTRANSVPALERATGRGWEEWLAHFAAHDAASLPHPEIARIARGFMPAELQNPDWWAQGAAIAFEQHAGLRVPGQSSTGAFRVSASRIVTMDRDTAIEAWVAGPGAVSEHLGHAGSEPRRSRTDKRTFWRIDLEGAGRVELAAAEKDAARSQLALQHTGLDSAEQIGTWRAHWKQLLARL